MTTRKLPETEWPKLLELDDTWLARIPAPGTADIFVHEDELGDIIGYGMVLHVRHFEPLWVRADHRGGLVVGRLWKAMCQFLDTCSISRAFCLT